MTLMKSVFAIGPIDHVGIRVRDRDVSVKFYEHLGFRPDPTEESPEFKATGMVNDAGARIHLIYNSMEAYPGGNVLLDQPVKWPGYTHAAFVVLDLDSMIAWLKEAHIEITEGPVVLGDGRRRTCFVRDPDLNVLEFNELLTPH